MSHRSKAAIAAAVAVLAVPASASAATKTVDMGRRLLPEGLPEGRPRTSTTSSRTGRRSTSATRSSSCRPGSTPSTSRARAGRRSALILPTGQSIAGANDAAGAPFWFNGQPNVSFNPQLGPPGLFGKKATYTGAKRIESGLPLAREAQALHGEVPQDRDLHVLLRHPRRDEGHDQGRVQERHRSRSAKADKSGAEHPDRLDSEDRQEARRTPWCSGNNVSVGASGAGGVESFAFFPANKTVKAGTTVNFRMSSKSFEDPHGDDGPR